MKALFFLFLVAALVFTGGCASGPRIQRSDVPIVRTLGWWAYQEELTIETFDVRVVEAQLNLMNSKALIEYELTGTLIGSPGWRPFVDQLFVSQRYTANKPESNGRIADFELAPVIKVKEVKSYDGESLSFSIVVQEVLESGGWGRTEYRVRCGEIEQTFELYQQK